jgi:ubiquinone/menaquinone biosynthesis C-methylase UbiE
MNNGKIKIGITEKEAWNEKWKEIFDHYQQDLRHAYYIRAVLNTNEKKIIELAAGSFRDTNALNVMGINCFGCDYSSQSVLSAKKQFPLIFNKLSEQDAFNINFPDKEFDLSFHNGFWALFSDDNDILKLIQEQVRITKYRIIATVHNAHNRSFVEYFNRLKENDPLYNIRFFEIDEITELMKSVTNNIKIIPVGKGKKYYEDDLINIGLGDAKYIKKSFDYHKMNLLETSERLLCIGEL